MSAATDASGAAKPKSSDGWAGWNVRKAQEGDWKCPTCLVTNGKAVWICPCCEYKRPGAPKTPAAGASGGGGSAFKFGGTPGGGTPALKFGGTPTSGKPAATPAFKFGGTPATGSKPVGTPAFKFGGTPAKSAVGSPAPAFKVGGTPKPVSFGGAGAGGSAAGGAGASKSAADDSDSDDNGDLATRYFKEAAGVEVAPNLHGTSPAAAEIYTHVPTGAHKSAVVLTHGSGECEQLGREYDEDDELTAPFPTIVPALNGLRVARVVTGGLHTAALTTDGRLFTWGCNDDGVLGRAGAENLPLQVNGGDLGDAKVVALDAGDSYMAAVSSTGDVFAWGTYKGRDGNMGYTVSVKNQKEPALVPGVRRYGRVARVACGSNHTLALLRDGRVLAWGYGEQGQLGRRVTQRTLRGRRGFAPSLTPYLVEVGGRASRSKRAVGVFAGGYHSFVVTAEGHVYAFGLNCYGQLGLGDLEDRFAATRVPAFDDAGIFWLGGGTHFSLALGRDGRVWGFGRGDSGQLGLSADARDRPPVGACSLVPLRLPASRFGGAGVRQLSCGSSFSVAVTADSQIYAWGFGDCNQLGNGEERDEAVPYHLTGEALAALKGKTPLAVAAGGQHVVVLAEAEGAPIEAGGGADSDIAAGPADGGAGGGAGKAAATKRKRRGAGGAAASGAAAKGAKRKR